MALLSFGSQAQKVSLFSGTPDPDNPGCQVGGSGTLPSVATWGQPWGMATDTNGNIWVTENYNSRVRMITSDFQLVYSRVGSSACPAAAGYKDAAGSQAQFNGPTGIAVGPDNKIYVADMLNNCIRKIDPFSNAGNSQSVTLLAGSTSGASGYSDATGGAALFDFPMDIAVDKNGNVYVADQNNNCIRKITPAGVVSTFAGSTTSGYKDGQGAAAQFATPWGLAIDQNGDLLVADFGNYRIRKVNIATSPAGLVSTIAGNGQQTVKDGSSTACSFNSLYDLVVDKKGNIFVAEGDQSHVIRWMNTAGDVVTIAGKYNVKDTLNGNGTSARFYSCTGITLSKDQKTLFIADDMNQTIRTIDIANLTYVIDFTSDVTSVQEAGIVNFTNNTSITTGTTYAWAITPGVSGTDWTLTTGTATSKDISVKFLKKGTYSVEMTATNAAFGGAKKVTKTNMITVTAKPGGIAYTPLTGVEIYPNPNNSDKLYINSKEFGISLIQLFDIQGKEVMRISGNGATAFELNMSGLEKGIYVVKTASGELMNISKIVLQ